MEVVSPSKGSERKREEKGKGPKKISRSALPNRSCSKLPRQQHWVPGPILRSSKTMAHMRTVKEYLSNMFTHRDLSYIVETKMSMVEHHETMARHLLQVVL